ncbi:MAG: UDP-N-acetylmuramoyl-L-alanyl-D-glutamate--2,6-diaminopimelate ligase [Planctomycetes bacterium RBG_13_46_10]|nr:MAG: UDP-N-acetylmuramoyl-L-alanyl-D-glutamate--2,6-diaminopimelate ligase [Planctomycetes bacterium RBG_13_46_10]
MTFNELIELVSSADSPRICVDSRLVKDGDIFVAVKGTIYDGHDFIDRAITNGAKYIVCQNDKRRKTEDRRQKNCEIISIEDSTEAVAILAQAKAGNPASNLTNLAVTGTNGKTTVAYLVRSCIRAAGQKCGLIGTVEYDTGSAVCEASMTTPDSLEIARIQKEMLKAGCEYMVIEASSHALSQNRLAGINFKAAAFTNLTGDHLDYHKTTEDYLDAKTKLFSCLSPDAIAVLNKQSTEAQYIAERTKAKILWYAIDEPADITAHIESMDINGTRFSILDSRFSLRIEIKTPLLGWHNISNHLAAAGLCLAAGFNLEAVSAGLSSLQGVPGRLEKVDFADFSVLVDYAHTDDALKNVLTTLKPLCKGKLIVVFGCGGDRDRTKRPRMAKVVEELANIVIVTSDNPRTEKPEDIINEILSGFENPKTEKITVESDRRKAIELAIETAGKDDIVLIAGKGHENYQIIGTQKFHFSDKEVATDFLEKRMCEVKQL